VDLPGYGYARVSKGRRAEWRPLIEEFLRRSPALRGVVQVLDVRHAPTDDDRLMLDLLADLGAPTIVVATKTDKLTPRQAGERLHALAVALALDEDQVIAFSAVSGSGRDELAAAIVALLGRAPWRST